MNQIINRNFLPLTLPSEFQAPAPRAFAHPLSSPSLLFEAISIRVMHLFNVPPTYEKAEAISEKRKQGILQLVSKKLEVVLKLLGLQSKENHNQIDKDTFVRTEEFDFSLTLPNANPKSPFFDSSQYYLQPSKKPFLHPTLKGLLEAAGSDDEDDELDTGTSDGSNSGQSNTPDRALLLRHMARSDSGQLRPLLSRLNEQIRILNNRGQAIPQQLTSLRRAILINLLASAFSSGSEADLRSLISSLNLSAEELLALARAITANLGNNVYIDLIHFAATFDRPDFLDCLLNNPAEVFSITSLFPHLAYRFVASNSVLDFAVRNQSARFILRILNDPQIQSGANFSFNRAFGSVISINRTADTLNLIRSHPEIQEAALISVSSFGDVQTFQWLFEAGLINQENFSRLAALAVKFNQPAILKFLLKQGLNTSADELLGFIRETENFPGQEMFELLISQGLSGEQLALELYESLYSSIREEQGELSVKDLTERLELLCPHINLLEQRDACGDNIISAATYHGITDVLDWFTDPTSTCPLERVAPNDLINLGRNAHGDDIFAMACACSGPNLIPIVRWFLSRGIPAARILASRTPTGTPFIANLCADITHDLEEHPLPECMRLLGVDIRALLNIVLDDREQTNVVHLLFSYAARGALNHLLQNGLTMDEIRQMRTTSGLTPFHMLASNDFETAGDLIETLEQNGVNLNDLLSILTTDGHNLLHLAAERGNLNLIAWFLDRNHSWYTAPPNPVQTLQQLLAMTTPEGLNFVHLAVRGGHLNILQWLVTGRGEGLPALAPIMTPEELLSMDLPNGYPIEFLAEEHPDIVEWIQSFRTDPSK